MANQTILLIDGQNFINRIRTVLSRSGVKNPDITKFDYWGFMNDVFKERRVDLASIYFAKLREHKETLEKSQELMERYDTLKTHLEGQGFRYVTSGTVRSRVGRDKEVTFQEKGVDAKIAVDMVTSVLDHQADTVILASSDSDLQPAIKEIRARGAKVIYLGFQYRRNRGIELTTDETVLVPNKQVKQFYQGDTQ